LSALSPPESVKIASLKITYAQNKKWARTHWTTRPCSEQETDYKGKREKGQKQSGQGTTTREKSQRRKGKAAEFPQNFGALALLILAASSFLPYPLASSPIWL
jgi:hypothetical protein